MDGIWGRAGLSLCIYLKVCMMFYSISGQLQTDSDGLLNGRDYEGVASLKEYIGEIYFNNYDNDSLFENFVEQEISVFSCGDSELIPKISLLDRYLVGEGSHRCLSTKVKLELPVDSWSEIQVHSFEVIFVEMLPNGVFADPFELKHLQHRRVFKKAFVFGDTNLELPSFLSNRSLVEVHIDVVISSLSNRLNFSLELPLHARYQSLDDGGYTNVEFDVPNVFLHYEISCNGTNMKSCFSVLKNDGGERRPNAVIWSIPSGIRAHEGVVSIVTFSSAVMATLLIVFVSLRHSCHGNEGLF